MMFFTNLRAGWKSIVKHRFHSIINILGFSVALSVVVLVGLYVYRELSVNKFHKDVNQIYKICGWAAPYPLATTIKAGVPELQTITNVVRVKNRYLISWNEKQQVAMESGYLAVDPEFFKIFTFPIIAGNAEDPLPNSRSIAIVESTAKAIFGNSDPIGQTVMATGWGGYNSYVVTAVLADIPVNSSIQFSALFRINPSQPYGTSTIGQYWKAGLYEIFAKLPEGSDVDALNRKMQDVVERSGNLTFFGVDKVVLYPFTEIYFDRFQLASYFKGGEYGKVMTMIAIGCVILLMAIINFFNLSTASGMMRSREIGLRKVNGATRRSLVVQFLTESILIAFIAMLLAIIVDNMVIPLFGAFVGVPYPRIMMTHGWEWLLLIGGSVVVGCLAGSYPAFYLSNVDPVQALYVGRVRSGFGVVMFRKVLIVFQLTAAIALIACTLVITGQKNYLANHDTGFDRDQLICVGMDASITRQKQAFLSEIRALPNVESFSTTSNIVGYQEDGVDKITVDHYGEEQPIYIKYMYADTAFFSTFGIEMVKGRVPVLPREYGYVVFNEAAMNALNGNDPLELRVNSKVHSINPDGSVPTVGVSGVCKNFNSTSLLVGIDPLMIIVVNDYPRGILNLRVRVHSMDNMIQLMDDLKKIYKKFGSSDASSNIMILDEVLRMIYIEETKYQVIFSLFSVFAVIIACFGLFGLILYSNTQRRKEIGVRKVYGSEVPEIVVLLIRGYLGYIAIAFVIATPIAYFFMNRWLQAYPYRVGLHWWYFALAGLIALMIVTLTVGIHSWRTASSNPIKALRSE